MAVAKVLTLGGLDPDRIGRALNHPEHLRNVGVVAELLRRMDRAGHDPRLLFNFQTNLFQASYRAQQADADIGRALGRLDDGKGPDWMGQHDAPKMTYLAPTWTPVCAPDSRDRAEWEMERVVARRVVRQLQDVGDGLAWRVYRYDRREIVALADHPSAGPVVNKSGLDHELGWVVDRFRDSGEFTLLHDLTTVLRHHDFTEVDANGYRVLREVKANPTTGNARAKLSKQRRQAEVALAAAAGTAPLGDGGTRLVRSGQQLRTHVRDLSGVMTVARRDGYVVTRVHDRIVGVLYLPTIAAAEADRDLRDVYDAYCGRLNATLDRCLPSTVPRLHARIGFTEPRNAFFAPYSIYPLPVNQRTALICDLAIVDTFMNPDRLCRGFEDLGLTVEYLIGSGSPPDADVLRVDNGHARATLHARAVSQLLFEFVQTDCFVRAFAASLDSPADITQAILTFSNEKGAWR